MKIVRRRESWVHTHFITDGERLATRDRKRIEKEIVPLLRQLRIVYGVHFREPEKDEGIHIVLECIPQEDHLEAIEALLRKVIEPIPKRPAAVQMALPRQLLKGAAAGGAAAENASSA